ncbi:unnamed protein product [Fusarium graminearum]|nr:unnamed protein product [Fusarium graminearum]
MKPAFLFCALLGIAQDVTAAVTDRQCSTRLGPVSVKNVKRVVKTVIPKPATTTITKVSTHPEEDRSFLDNRYRTTAIEDSTVTTATATSFTTTITITTSTSTIPGPAGFTPAASDVSYRAKKREVPKRLYRAMTSINRHKLTLKVNSKKCEYSPALCPQAVNCREVIKTVITKTVTLKQCKKTPTRTVVLPRRTKTQTSVAPSATFYAACASNNLVSATNGNHGIDSINFNDDTSNNDIIVIGTASAYNCSMACQTTSNCIFSDFAFGGCQLVIGSSCSTAATFGTSYQTNSNVPADRGVVISNGPCGSIQNLGNVGQERTVQ